MHHQIYVGQGGIFLEPRQHIWNVKEQGWIDLLKQYPEHASHINGLVDLFWPTMNATNNILPLKNKRGSRPLLKSCCAALQFVRFIDRIVPVPVRSSAKYPKSAPPQNVFVCSRDGPHRSKLLVEIGRHARMLLPQVNVTDLDRDVLTVKIVMVVGAFHLTWAQSTPGSSGPLTPGERHTPSPVGFHQCAAVVLPFTASV